MLRTWTATAFGCVLAGGLTSRAEAADLSAETESSTSYSGLTLTSVDTTATSPAEPSPFRFEVYQPFAAPPVAPGYGVVYGVGPNGQSLVGPEGATNLSITLSTGMTGADLIGASLEGKDASGSPTHMRIDAVGVGAAPNQDLLYLNVSVEESGEWVHLCGAENGVPVPALPFPGKWNQDNGRWTNTTRKFSFACRGSAIAKCMEAGYKPWRQYELDSRTFNGSAKAGNGTAEGTITVYSNRDFEASGTKTRNGESRDFSRERTYPAPGADALQACVRMIRADYCGNGESHTVDGRIVDFWDNLGVHEQTHKEWTAEAIWGPEGASCFFSPRVSSGEKGYPSCVNKVRPDRFLCNVRQPHGVLGQILSNSYQAQARQ